MTRVVWPSAALLGAALLVEHDGVNKALVNWLVPAPWTTLALCHAQEARKTPRPKPLVALGMVSQLAAVRH